MSLSPRNWRMDRSRFATSVRPAPMTSSKACSELSFHDQVSSKALICEELLLPSGERNRIA